MSRLSPSSYLTPILKLQTTHPTLLGLCRRNMLTPNSSDTSNPPSNSLSRSFHSSHVIVSDISIPLYVTTLFSQCSLTEVVQVPHDTPTLGILPFFPDLTCSNTSVPTFTTFEVPFLPPSSFSLSTTFVSSFLNHNCYTTCHLWQHISALHHTDMICHFHRVTDWDLGTLSRTVSPTLYFTSYSGPFFILSDELPLLSLSNHIPFRPHLIPSGKSFHKVTESSTKPVLPTPLSKICTLHFVTFWPLLPCVVSLTCISLYFPWLCVPCSWMWITLSWVLSGSSIVFHVRVSSRHGCHPSVYYL